jgi:hypothetical protein
MFREKKKKRRTYICIKDSMLGLSKKKKTETVCVLGLLMRRTNNTHTQTETKLIKYLPRTAIREIDRQKKEFSI